MFTKQNVLSPTQYRVLTTASRASTSKMEPTACLDAERISTWITTTNADTATTSASMVVREM